MNRSRIVQVIALTLLLVAPSARAQWLLDGAAACTNVAGQYLLIDQSWAPYIGSGLVADGAGGAILVWADGRNDQSDIYAQRFDGSGSIQWALNGVALCNSPNGQDFPAIVSDGAGGAIVTWNDNRTFTQDIYAQRISASGVPQWTSNGVLVCGLADSQYYPKIVSDGAGGAIITWQDYRTGIDIYAQRINSAGAPLWTTNGVPICTRAGDQTIPKIVSDDAGGAIVAWTDGPFLNGDLYAQRVNAGGVVQWATNGVALCVDPTDQDIFAIMADGAGGAIVAWQDIRNGDFDIYAQRVSASGVAQWTADGAWVCVAFGGQGLAPYGALATDDAGGAIIAWHDIRDGVSHDIFAQRVDASGAPVWGFNGVGVCMAAADQGWPTVVSDGSGGAVVAWHDSRGGPEADVYAQRVNANGSFAWTSDGVRISGATGGQTFPQLVADGSGGAIVAWNDFRWSNSDVFVQRVEDTYGYWGHPEPVLVAAADIPNDQGGKVGVYWRASDRDRPVPRTIGHYSIWRVVPTPPPSSVVAAGSGAPRIITDLRDVGPDATGPLYAVLPSGPAPQFELFLEFIGTQSAHGWPNYSYSAWTRADSVAGSSSVELFVVAAHDKDDDYVAFLSNAKSAHSVDNLAPPPPLMLTAHRVGADVQLRWNHSLAPDLGHYSVYRASASA